MARSDIRLVSDADRGRALARQTKQLTSEAVRVHRWGLFSEPAGRALRAWAEGRTPDLAKIQGELAHDVQYPSRLAAVIRAREDAGDPVR